MERIRAERTVARRIFSRACTALDQELKKEEVDYESACAKMRTMEYEAQKLFEIDEDMKVKLFAEKMDEEDQVKEFEDMSDFRSKFFLYSGKFETYVRLRKEASGSVDEQSVVSVYGQFDTKSKRNLKIDQMKYETDSHKSQYPFQSSVVGAKARKVLERFPPSGENYHEELSYRKESVAKDDFLIRPYYRQLLNLVIQQVYSKTDISLSDIFDRLSAQLRALKHLGVTKEKYAATVEACLPVDVLKAWSRFRLTPAAATIGSEKTPDLMVANIIVFLKAEGESDERKRLSTNGLSSSESKTISNKKSGAIPTAATVLSIENCTKPRDASDCNHERKLTNSKFFGADHQVDDPMGFSIPKNLLKLSTEIPDELPSKFLKLPRAFNPADLPSRGLGGRTLLGSRWWEERNSLISAEDKWSSSSFIAADHEKNSIDKTVIGEEVTERVLYIPRYSQIVRMITSFVRLWKTRKRSRKQQEVGQERLIVFKNRKRIFKLKSRKRSRKQQEVGRERLIVFKNRKRIFKLKIEKDFDKKEIDLDEIKRTEGTSVGNSSKRLLKRQIRCEWCCLYVQYIVGCITNFFHHFQLPGFEASKTLSYLVNWDKICSFSDQKFNPPIAAWWGGWWERVVWMIKELVMRNLGQAALTYEELTTVICDIEAVINARPLTYVAEEAEELQPISPKLFIQDIKSTKTDFDTLLSGDHGTGWDQHAESSTV